MILTITIDTNEVQKLLEKWLKDYDKELKFSSWAYDGENDSIEINLEE